MILRAKADSLELDAGENGWSLIAETDEGDTIVLNIHGVAHEFARSNAVLDLLEWASDGEEAAAAVRAQPSLQVEGDHLG